MKFAVTLSNLSHVPELPEVEITARLIGAAAAGAEIESVLAPGLNALKTFDPPLHALAGSTISGIRRRGKLFLIDLHAAGLPGSAADYTLVVHLMSAGRLQLYDKRASLKDKTSRVLLRLADGERELRLREFGTKQRAWAKLLRREARRRRGDAECPRPGGVAGDAGRRDACGTLLDQPRPLYALLRDQHVIAGIGRSWVDEILHTAKLSPFKRGSDLDAMRPSPCATRSTSVSAAPSSLLRADAGAAAPRQAAVAAHRPPSQRRALPTLRHHARGRLLRGLRDVLLPGLPDRRQGAQGPPVLAATEVARFARFSLICSLFPGLQRRKSGRPTLHLEHRG